MDRLNEEDAWRFFSCVFCWMTAAAVALTLAGMTAALLACRLPAYEAAACAVYLHGAAADRAAAVHGEYGMLPHDILPELGRMFAEHQR